MKFCFLADGSHINTQEWVTYFANELGHEVSLITFNPVKEDLKNVKIFYIKSPFVRSKLRYLLDINKVKKLLEVIKPNILIGYRIISYGLTAAATGFHPLILVTTSGKIVHPGKHPSFFKIFAKFSIKRADLIHSWGEHITKDLISLGASPSKIITFPRGVNIANFYIMKKLDERGRCAISTRSLKPFYNIRQMIKAVPAVINEVEDFELLLAGEGKDKMRLKSLARNLGVTEKVKFLGKVGRSELPNLLNSCQIYLATVISDGVSASLLEAMACGLFPIVIDNEANRLWIEDGVNGFLIPYGDVENLASKVVKAIRDDELRKKAQRINWEIVKERACWEKNMKKMEEAYLKIRAQFSPKSDL